MKSSSRPPVSAEVATLVEHALLCLLDAWRLHCRATPTESEPAEARERPLAGPPDDRAMFFTVKEFCQRARIGKTTFYAEVSAGRIRSLKVGRKTMVPAAEIQEWISRLSGDE